MPARASRLPCPPAATRWLPNSPLQLNFGRKLAGEHAFACRSNEGSATWWRGANARDGAALPGVLSCRRSLASSVTLRRCVSQLLAHLPVRARLPEQVDTAIASDVRAGKKPRSLQDLQFRIHRALARWIAQEPDEIDHADDPVRLCDRRAHFDAVLRAPEEGAREAARVSEVDVVSHRR